MASWRRDLLTPLQGRVLDALGGEPHELFLSGGAALGGFHLHHRSTLDLDLFTTVPEAMSWAAGWSDRLSRALDARLCVERVGPSFRRVVLETPAEAVRVDFVHDAAPQIVPVKPVVAGVRIDTLEDLVCNKVGAVPR